MSKNITFIILILSLVSCKVSKDIEISSGAKVSENSLIYALPQTTLVVTIEATKTSIQKGPYAEFAEKYLHIRNAPMWNSESWNITNATIETRNEADPNNYYTITYRTYPENLGKLFSVSGKGVILDFPNAWKNSLRLRLPGEKSDSVYDPELVKETETEKVDTFYKTILTDSTFRRIPVIKKQILAKTPEDEAGETAKLILKIRKSRIKLLRGKLTYPPDGESLKTDLEGLDKLEKLYLSMFIGIKTEEKRTYTYYITPKNDTENSDLCYFSTAKGIQAQEVTDSNPVTLQLHKEEIPAETNAPDKSINTLYIRIPVITTVSIKFNSEDLASLRVPIYQFGPVRAINFR